MAIKRLLHPSLNAPGYMAAAGAIYAAAVMIYNAHAHHGVISVPVVLAAITATGALLTRQVVTPTADPVDGAGRPLIPKPDFIPAPAVPASGSVRIVPPQPVSTAQGTSPEPPETAS